MAESITYDNFVDLVEDMVENKEDGSLYLRTNKNHSVFVGVRNGEIEALVSGPRRGLKAIKTILQMSTASCRRDTTALSFHSGDLPPTGEILHMLRNRREMPEVEETLSSPASRGLKPAADSTKTSGTAAVLCELLHDYLGPVASIICDEITEEGARLRPGSDLDSVIRELAEEIDSVTESREFISRAHKAIGTG